MSDKEGLLPQPSETTTPYWKAVDEQRLELQVCTECEQWLYYPREWCPHCFNTEFRWEETSGKGEIHTFSLVHYSPTRGYEDETPYPLAIVMLEEGPQMLTNIVNCEPEDVSIGDEVRVTFEQRGERWIPQFEPV